VKTTITILPKAQYIAATDKSVNKNEISESTCKLVMETAAMNYKQNGLARRFEAEKLEILLSFLASTLNFFWIC
jgi:hypothetical protein